MRIISKQLRLKIRECFDEAYEFETMCEALDIRQKDLIKEVTHLWDRLLEEDEAKANGNFSPPHNEGEPDFFENYQLKRKD
jgi:hypothetical protein